MTRRNDLEEYLVKDLINAKVPWPIVWVDLFKLGKISCAFLAVVSFAIFLVYCTVFWLSFTFLIMLSGVLLGFIHNYSSRFANIVDVLGSDLIDMKVERWDTLRFEAMDYGKFTLRYVIGSKYTNSSYKLWIVTSKDLPVGYNRGLDIWSKDTLYDSSWGDEKYEQQSKYVTRSDVSDLPSLKEIKLERGLIANRIVATLNDMWFHSVTPDILGTLKVIRNIEDKMSNLDEKPELLFDNF
ncbi:MAG: hypothetical protein JSW28_07035 [Thermoplasmata archaeon]|nr:MAG: hypothetical protein JSW28_07035 [Thermoplasmata archaeon]